MMHRAVQHGLNDMRAAGYLGGLPPFWLHLVMDAYAKAGSQPPGAARTDQQCADRLRSRNRAQCAFWARRPGAANVALLLNAKDAALALILSRELRDLELVWPIPRECEDFRLFWNDRDDPSWPNFLPYGLN